MKKSFFPAAVAALLVLLCPSAPLSAQDADEPLLTADALRGLELRAIGPALMSGRIADIAIDPSDRSTWYVAVGSGGVWKTTNAGTTWTPIFDDQGSYSIGAITLDPSNPQVVWVGTGENVSGRHVGFGDGVYRSRDGGGTWEHLGLERSEHIGKIVVHPENADVVWVAAEGPLWSSGGERGLYKTDDGGTTWRSVLAVDDNTGVTDLEIDPRDPDVLYAATYERRRRVWSLLAGGPGSGIHKSTDGGESWREVTAGLPQGPMGKIGLAISPLRPDVLYATIEANEQERGFYRSDDRGESWEKRNSYISGGTGPHYYQEIYASPHVFDRVYQMDVFMQITDDGGRTFRLLGEPDKHSDNHALAFDPNDPDWLLSGSDGGLYQTWDHGRSWSYVANLPVTQIYKMTVDYDEPFYNVVGGTQDNGTQSGPSRTLNVHGIRNQDWYVPYGADGYATQVDPTNPDLLYVTWQNGHLLRYDRRAGEALDIQPQPGPDDPPERWNWDSPVLLSPHDPSRIWFGSQRLWRSDDRGDSWQPVSGDLSRGVGRYQREIAGRVQSADALWGNTAMSWYGNITAIAESPLVEGLLYVGTDDGLIQVSEDGGATWRRSEPTGIAADAFVNEVKASHHDPDRVFAAIDDHKSGDFAPYLLRSDDRGRTWRSIAGDLPERHLVWSMEEDHEDADLLFAGTELGLYFTVDGGERWIELAGGVPTIAFRDLEIQRRENDLVAASFGRGFYVLDDYTSLRSVSEAELEAGALLFPVRDALHYVPSVLLATRGSGMQGSDYFMAPNPPFGALFTFWLKEDWVSAKEQRRQQEQELGEEENVPFPGWDRLREEDLEVEARLLLTVRDAAGEVVRRLEAPTRSGVQRVAWDLRYPPSTPVQLEVPTDLPPWVELPVGPLAPPGEYTVTLARLEAGIVTPLAEPQRFTVRALENRTLSPEESFEEILTFQQRTAELQRRALAAAAELERTEERLRHLEAALVDTPQADPALFQEFEALRRDLAEIRRELVGDPTIQRFQEPEPPSILGRIQIVVGGLWSTRQAPTATQRQSVDIAQQAFTMLQGRLRELIEERLVAVEEAMEEAGAPWTPGRRLP